MSTRLQQLDLTDFTGGLATRRSQFTLSDNESPNMLNIEIDPRAGFYTRKGWQRWNTVDIDDPSTWDPRNAALHPLSTGLYQVYVATSDTLYVAASDTVFSPLATVAADDHGCDFAAWGDTMYFAPGHTIADPFKHVAGDGFPTLLGDAGLAFNDDYTLPGQDPRFPRCDLVEAHNSYLFVAGVYEGNRWYPNRIRWSHPDQPEDWHSQDFLDIDLGGGRITALISYQDHLLIFKSDSVWALYGYDLDSWQLVRKSNSVGVPGPTTVGRSEDTVFFFSTTSQGGVFAYIGNAPVDISERLRDICEAATIVSGGKDIWVGWLGHRLWISLPWRPEDEPRPDSGLDNLANNTVLVFDPEVGEGGAWMKHRAGRGSVGPFVSRSAVDTGYSMAVMRGDADAACVIQLEYRDDAYDVVLESYSPQFTDETDGFILTDLTDDGAAFIDGTSERGDPFQAFYRTGWKHAGWPERRKSWRRGRYVVRIPRESVRVQARIFWDYEESNARRQFVGQFDPGGAAFWREAGSTEPDRFQWGDGTLWGASNRGGRLDRIPRGAGVSRALQIEVSSDPSTRGRAWGFDMIELKYVLRRFTT